MKSITIVATIVALAVGSCSKTSQRDTIADLTATLGSASAAIAAIEGNGALAQQIEADTKAAVDAVKQWNSGMPDRIVIADLNLIAADLNLIPDVGPYVPLIDIGIGAIDTILAELPDPSSKVIHRPIHLTQPAPKTAAQFRQQWNKYLALNPGLNLQRL